MHRSDVNSNYQKAKLIDGLPNLFVERVRQNLKGDNATIDYSSCTYGQLTVAVIQEDLKLRNNLKLQK